jgi:hypothetical protein
MSLTSFLSSLFGKFVIGERDKIWKQKCHEILDIDFFSRSGTSSNKTFEIFLDKIDIINWALLFVIS